MDYRAADYDEANGPPLWPEDPIEQPRTFEIGLVLAGAVSAGAYIGGVLDFLFEALDAYEVERLRAIAAGEAGADKRHKVLVRVISGASAGGMSAAMLAASARRAFPHIRTDADAKTWGDRNPFYSAWVQQVDMTGLLGTDDLVRPEAPVRSLLDCSALDKVVKNALSFPQAHAEHSPLRDRGWLPDRLKLCFTVTNLRGVPYRFLFEGSQGAYYTMTRHADIARFSVRLRGQAPARPDEVDLVGESSGQDAGWQALGQAALATGSFPLALRSRTVVPLPTLYDASYFLNHARVDPGAGNPPRVVSYTINGTVLHIDDDRDKVPAYTYASADGGMIDNEPLEWARVELAGILGRNPRNPGKANRALIMVDPFPDPPAVQQQLAAERRAVGGGAGRADAASDDHIAYADADSESLFTLATGMIGALKNQGRFHPEDIRLALDPSVYSRFTISPSGRYKPDPAAGRYTGGAALASGALGGFSGFLCPAYRHHDFMLGRANCRSFLEKHFRIPVFAKDETDQSLTRSWLFAEEPETQVGDTKAGRAVIPLIGIAGDADDRPAWPADKWEASGLRQPIRWRLQLVARRSIDLTMEPGWFRFVLDYGWRAFGGGISGALAGRLVAQINRSLRDHGLRT